ncbi:uncharacterized protein LOC120710821 [Panicum virgatum]|uniref:Avr9/Cf-9 rapidly elicited protein 146 n=1 Tax=Panicum virgatum TaxID=38727 RepID=A0A8T0SWB3_PANVG|nr:uncharacterized protein LOC120710821 [Panicum virgatum]KAG2603150.1 hypothetical protein PVAP13_5KG749500 [Panicum virgatum]
MEVHSAPAVGKRMWSYLRAVFFMARKGLLSNKRKLLLGMHLLIKRRNKAVSRTVAALLSHHHRHGHGSNHALRRRGYEFSCTNSPDPAASSRRHLAYFPCLGAVAEEDAAGRIEYYGAAAAASPAPSSSPGLLLREELAPGEPAAEESYCCACASPALLLGGGDGAFSVRVSNYSSEDEGGAAAGHQAVDDEAEEFIRRFYEQLRRQNTVALLPYMHESAAA